MPKQKPKEDKDIIRPLTIEVNKKVWDQWKITVPRDITLSRAVGKLVEKDFEEQNKK